jgi:hypothetical protein
MYICILFSLFSCCYVNTTSSGHFLTLMMVPIFFKICWQKDGSKPTNIISENFYMATCVCIGGARKVKESGYNFNRKGQIYFLSFWVVNFRMININIIKWFEYFPLCVTYHQVIEPLVVDLVAQFRLDNIYCWKSSFNGYYRYH